MSPMPLVRPVGCSRCSPALHSSLPCVPPLCCPAARPLLAAIPVLAKRHAVVVASVADDDLEQLVVSEPDRPIDVYRAVAASDVLEARDHVVAALGHAGARVLTASRDAFPAACVRAYVQMKARGAF